MKKKLFVLTLFLLFLLLTMSGCVPGDGAYTASHPAGFWWGFWHGMIAPISLIIGLFSHGVRIYEVANTGLWYDFGFWLAIVMFSGGICRGGKKRCKKDH